MKKPAHKTGKQSVAKPSPDAAIVEDAVSGKLKAFYAEVELQPVPQNLLDLLDELDRSGNQSS